MSDVLGDDFEMSLSQIDRTRINTFQHFVNILGEAFSWGAITRLGGSASLPYDTNRSLFNIPTTPTGAAKCPACNFPGPVIEFSFWDTLQPPSEFFKVLGYEFTDRTRSLVRHAQHNSEWVQNEQKDEYNTLLQNVEQLATTFLGVFGKEHDIPPEIQKCPLFLPDEMGVYSWIRGNKWMKDCLGRTWLHQYLDSKKNNGFFRKLEQVMVDFKMENSLMFSIDKQDIIGRTPLHIACEKGLPQFAAKLIERGADVTKQTAFMMTPLHLAAASGSAEIVGMMLKSQRININALDMNGCTPLHYAYRHQHPSIYYALRADERTIPDVQCQSQVCENWMLCVPAMNPQQVYTS